MTIPLPLTSFSESDCKAFEPALKIGMLATINPQGLPHLTMISSLKAGTPTTVLWGQFTEGSSKVNVAQNPNTGFMIMSLDKILWRGKARWTGTARTGEDFEWFNNVPMFRYNAYFGIHTVHYMDLIGQTGGAPLPMNAIVLAAVKTMLARSLAPTRGGGQPLNQWTQGLFNKLDNLKFLAFIDDDGFPFIIPVIQAQADGRRGLIFSAGVFSEELAAIRKGSPVAVLGMALTMEDVLVRGEFEGLQRRAGVLTGSVKVDWVYNPMPPVAGQIYPPLPLQEVREF